MVNYVKRLVYVDADETRKVNPLFYPFIWATLIYGFGFMAGGWWSGVSSSSLFQAFNALHHWLPTVWGFAAFMSGAFALVLLLRRSGDWGDWASMGGALIWIFAAFVYAQNGFWLVLLTVACPNLYFWVFYYFSVKNWERQKKLGLIQDPE